MKIRWSSLLGLWWAVLFTGTLAAQQTVQDSLQVQQKNDSVKTKAQNIFDADNSRKFADYLFRTGQYDYATEEYQRIVFMRPVDIYPKWQIIRAQKAKKDFQKALNYYALYFPRFDTLPVPVQKEGIRLYILTDDYESASYWLNKSRLAGADKATWHLGIEALKLDWDKALEYYKAKEDHIDDPVFHQFGLVVQRRLEQPHRSPFVAASLSTVVPGLGKVYTKNYGDAAMSFLFVGLNAWQAYRGFHKEGVKSVHGWIFAGLGMSFYLGNIWGSAKAAKRFNKQFDKEATDEIKAVFEYNL